MKKKQRQALLKKIVEENEVETQEELLQHLKKYETSATQATISRDIRELKIVKARNNQGKTVYTFYSGNVENSTQHLQEMIQEMVKKLDRVQFMTILHTTTGSADLVAALLDDLRLPEIVATMAGTDTLLIISPNEEQAQEVYRTIENLKNS